MSFDFDVIVIGGGPGGYVAAIRAARLGAKTALIEKENLGGVCLNRGCIPTKALIASAKAYHHAKSSEAFGVSAGSVSFDMSVAQTRKEKIVSTLRGGIEQLVKGSQIELIRGEARFSGKNTVSVAGRDIASKYVVVATGSSWIKLPNIKLDGQVVVTSDEALSWNSVPQRVAIIGGGVVGCEFACMLSALGTKITIVEATDSILPPVERELTRVLTRSMKAKGIEILTGTFANSVEATSCEAKVSLSNGSSIEADKILVAIGRRPYPESLNLAAAGIEQTEKGFIKVDNSLRTTADGIYAIGDVRGGMMLAHSASADGIAAVEHALQGKEVHERPVPAPIFTHPEIASVGRTAESLKTAGVEFKTGRFPYLACGKAHCDGETEGQVIVHADPTGKRIYGVHVLGLEATTIIAEATLAITHGMSVEQLDETIHAHPTLSETLAEASADVLGMAIHKAAPRKR